VETGVGPVCREKHWVADKVTESARQEGNKLFYLIALHQKGTEVDSAIARLVELGFTAAVKRIRKRLGNRVVEITYTDDRLVVKTGRLPGGLFDSYLTRLRSIHGRRWDSERQANTFPHTARVAVWGVIREFFAGYTLQSPKGESIIPG